MSETNTNSPLQALAVPISIVVAGAIIGVCLLIALKGTGGAAVGQVPGAEPSIPVNVKDVNIEGAPFIGNKDAKVVLVTWEDYECPFCARHETQVMPTLIKDYVDTGKVKIVFKDYQFLGPNSTLAGHWGHAIWKLFPEKFAAWRSAHWANHPPEHSLTLEQYEAHLAKMATQVGIDAAKVKADVAANKATYDAILAADQAEATGFGINGTPGFITGEVRIDGAQPLPNFIAALDAQL